MLTLGLTELLALGLDQGGKSGWGIVRGTPGLLGKVLHSGVTKTAQDRERVVSQALDMAEYLLGGKHHLVAVIEDHSKISLRYKKGQRSAGSILGQGASAGKWEHVLELAGIEVRRVDPNTWFCAMSGHKPRTKRKDRKRWSMDYVRTLGVRPKDDNEADGVCLAVFGAMNFAPRRMG